MSVYIAISNMQSAPSSNVMCVCVGESFSGLCISHVRLLYKLHLCKCIVWIGAVQPKCDCLHICWDANTQGHNLV